MVRFKYRILKSNFFSISNLDPHQSLILSNAIYNSHQLVIYAYQFLRLFILYKYESNLDIPLIDKNFISQTFKILSTRDNRGSNGTTENSDIKADLRAFYDSHFKQLHVSRIPAKNLTNILSYLAGEMLTAINQTIIKNFFPTLFRYLNILFQHNEIIEWNTKKDFFRQIKSIKNDLLNNTYSSNLIWHRWIKANRKLLLPTTDNIYDLLRNHPQQFFKHFIYINNKLESCGYKQSQFFPLRSTNIPSYIPLDTQTLIMLFSKNKTFDRKFQSILKDEIWGRYFRMNKKIFKSIKEDNKTSKDYVFDYRILTDGIGVSIQFIHYSCVPGKIEKLNKMANARRVAIKEKAHAKKNGKEHIKKSKTKPINKQKPRKSKQKFIRHDKFDLSNIEDLNQTNLDRLKNQNLVYIDPGKHTLLMMLGKNGEIKRYTKKQRTHEIKSKLYQKILYNYREKSGILEIEDELTACDFKSCNFTDFKESIKIKNAVNEQVKNIYQEARFRKFKWYTFINKQRSEAKLVNEIKKTFGTKDNPPILIIGNWSATKQLKGIESTPGIGLKKRLVKDFEMYHIDEFNTSKLHWKTEEPCENMRKQYTVEISKKIHSVLRAKLENGTYGCINRDLNSVRNIKKITNHIIETGVRPEKYKRRSNSAKA